ncbi:twin-arginine translocation signal domain-containing protein [Mesorhizobium sp. A556]
MHKTTDARRATAEAMPTISRRRFLTGTAMAGAVVAVAAPAAAAEPARPTFEPLVYAEDRVNMWEVDHPKPSRRERVIWHLRELKKLAFADGASSAHVAIIATYGQGDVRAMAIQTGSQKLIDRDGMFAPKGGAK